MRNIINIISSSVDKDILIPYFNHQKVDHRKIDWDKSDMLLPLDIERALNKVSNEKRRDVLQDFQKVISVAHDLSMQDLEEMSETLPPWINNNFEAAFWMMINDLEIFQKAEDMVFYRNPHRIFLTSILTNGKFLGGVILSAVFVINLAMILSDQVDGRYVYLNAFHFIMGSLVAFLGYEYDRRKK